MAKTRILAVDDEEEYRCFLVEVLIREGYNVETVESGEAALALFDQESFDLAVLDLHLGFDGIDGIELLQALRQQSPETVVIILTAYASLETAIEALRQGAHDYLFKPCRPAQLRESVRQGLLKPGRLPAEDPPHFLRRGGLTVDLFQHKISMAGRLLALSPAEFEVLAHLVRRAPHVVSPKELVYEVLNYPGELVLGRDLVRQHVFNLRRAIEKVSGRVDVIITRRGVGYAINEEPGAVVSGEEEN